DDGAVVYLNGIEVARANLRLGFQGPGVEAANAVDDPRAWFDYRLPATAVQPGKNLVAVEVHLSDPTDATLGFDLRLIGYDPRRSPIEREPYVTGVTSDRAVIRWRTGDRLGTRLAWGTDPNDLEHDVSDPTLGTEHRVVLDGLEPGATYFYRAGDLWDRIDPGVRRFATLPPADLDRPLRLWILGDPGTGDRHAARVRQAFRTHVDGQPPDAWLVLGNLGFENGTDDEIQRGFFDMYSDVLATRPPWPALGNHDLKSTRDGAGPWFDAFELPSDAEAGGVASGTETYYAIDLGPIHVVVLDTASTAAAAKPMLAWLEEDLAASDRPWTLVVANHPPYSAGWRRSDDPQQTRLASMRNEVVPLLEAAGVDLMVAGYNPSYERSFLLHGRDAERDGLLDTGDGREDGDGAYRKARGGPGTVYVVAGSGARRIEGDLDHPAMAVSLLRRGSLIVDVYDRRMSVAFVDATGRVADRFTLLHE
ncbi:MAG: metallophosphoesterase family protein, partial [Acidobacteriota bacterium]